MPLSVGKGALFGAGIGAIACYHGLQVNAEVGALPKAVVAAGAGSLTFVIVVDLIAVRAAADMTDPSPPVEHPGLLWQRRQIVALIVLSVLLALALAGGIAYQHGVFTSRAQVYFLADDATGLSPGTPVRMSGFRIGKISAMHLQPDLSVKVELTIETEPYSHLKSDARADVVREQLRPAAIDLRPGSCRSNRCPNPTRGSAFASAAR